MRRVLFCGGGTGGHILPGLAIAEELRRWGWRDLLWIGDPERLEARLVPAAGIPLLPCGLPRPRPWSWRWWLAALRALWDSWRLLRQQRPGVLVALGGYAALLPGLLAPLLGRPLVLLEQNARPGKANRWLSGLASCVVVHYPSAASELPRARCLGNPVRRIACRRRATGPELTVLVMGGSLAAKSLNDLVALAAHQLRALPQLRLVHIAGEQDRERVSALYRAAGIAAEVHGFVTDMPALYERADLAVCRAGATTLAELCVAGIGSVLVPLPWAADDHQTANARALAEAGAALVLPQASSRPEDMARLLLELCREPARITAMGEAAARLGRPAAARQVAALICGLAEARQRRAQRRQAARAAWRRHLLSRSQR
ncbi:MAG: undecaprenyldiphospho-muramoylpentapeptide beta-N-acetylglucosaminyltransferase [Planctomycetota bacterium]|nr:undecaprenyldiphospho-muramoylpentapeptide beta-N-acetylglucosaminyltransferase [Planctomycetota bacterium]MCX8039029.1 undecaprenyldiphospho-muramoylpentapeptide beta-N-acetylglucosaminyltransferase [Planctomycetota bacterium]MDW8372720.1 undecaprenyldiphospho-muramoylpentapeptide beta-N-acetylglucosaminyltransferase [Planctomycetota bacterium]